jgi:hypothetical protein
VSNSSTDPKILTSLHGRELGLNKARNLVAPSGFISGPGVSAGAGITSGTGNVFRSSVIRIDNIIRTQIFVDLTGLASTTTDLDIIGVGSDPAYLGQITTAVNGHIFGGRMGCCEVPTGGVTDIDLYAATEGTGAYDAGIATLAETALVTAGGAWTRTSKALTALPVADAYLYLTSGAAGTAATYTGGRFVIELDGYVDV